MSYFLNESSNRFDSFDILSKLLQGYFEQFEQIAIFFSFAQFLIVQLWQNENSSVLVQPLQPRSNIGQNLQSKPQGARVEVK